MCVRDLILLTEEKEEILEENRIFPEKSAGMWPGAGRPGVAGAPAGAGPKASVSNDGGEAGGEGGPRLAAWPLLAGRESSPPPPSPRPRPHYACDAGGGDDVAATGDAGGGDDFFHLFES